MKWPRNDSVKNMHVFLFLLFSCQVISNSLGPHGLEHTRLSCPFIISQSLTKLMSFESVMSSNHLILCHPYSTCLQSFPGSGSFQISQLFLSGDQSIRASVSASVLLKSIQGWFPLRLTGLISLLTKGLSRVFSSTAVKKHQYFGAQLSL